MKKILFLFLLSCTGLYAQKDLALASSDQLLEDATLWLTESYKREGVEETRQTLNQITTENREKLPFWVAAVELELQEGNPQIALGLLHKSLRFNPEQPELVQYREGLTRALHQGKAWTTLQNKEPQDLPSNHEFRISTAAQSRVFTQFYTPQFQNSFGATWKYKKGSVLLRANYAYRFEENALQIESDWYPKLSDKAYLYVNYGYSGTELFPTHRAGLEYFTNLPNAWEASLGARYLSFAESNVGIYTASTGYYYGNYYSSFRAFFVPKEQGRPGISASIKTRKYLKTAFQYLDLELGAGYDTEFQQQFLNGSIATQTQLYIQQQFLSLGYNQWNQESKTGYRIDLRADRLELPFLPDNYTWSATLGIQYQWGF